MNKPDVEMVATDKLIPYARNAKKHDEAQVFLLAGSIRQFGFNNPILIAEDNGIVAGHGRVLAAMKLGMAEVPCIRLSHLDENQRRAYILADNRLAELGGGWDLDMLAAEMDALGSAGTDLDSIGFDALFVDDVMNAVKTETEGDEPEQVLHQQSVQLEPEREYIVVVAKNQEEWEEMKAYFKLQQVRRGGYKEGSAFDAIGTERVLPFERVKNARGDSK